MMPSKKPLVFAWLLVGALLWLSGCTRSTDPLDWKIEGRHLDDLKKSTEHIVASLPQELSQEFVFCCSNIKADALAKQPGTATAQADLLCRRLREKSVREVLIEGYGLAHRTSEAQLAYQSDLLVRLLQRDDLTTDARGQPMAQRIESTKTLIESLKQKQAKSERRLAELRATAAK